MFTIIEDGYVVLRKHGLFRPCKCYLRHGFVYAGFGGGFVRLLRHENGTSAPNITYEDLTLPFTPSADSLGRLMKPATV